MCGTTTGSGVATSGDGQPTRTINTFELQEDLRSRTVKIHLTDEAVSHVGDALTAVFADRITGRPRAPHRITTQLDATPLLSPAAAHIDSDDETPETPTSLPPVVNGSDQERLHQIFEYVGDELRLEEDRLKADSGLDYARRLTYLFLYAHEVEGRKPLAYASLKKILETARLSG